MIEKVLQAKLTCSKGCKKTTFKIQEPAWNWSVCILSTHPPMGNNSVARGFPAHHCMQNGLGGLGGNKGFG